jgi:ribosomal protein L37AE/L43A
VTPAGQLHTARVDDDRPPICPACGVTTVPAVLSSRPRGGGWICLECEETGDGGAESAADVQVGTERGWDAP